MQRIIIPILAILLGLLVAVSMLKRGGAPSSSQSSNNPRQVQPTGGETDGAEAPTSAAQPAPHTSGAELPPAEASDPPATTAVSPPPVELPQFEGLLSLSEGQTPDAGAVHTIGSDQANSLFKLKVDLVHWGAGIDSITLVDFAKEADRPESYVLSQRLSAPRRGADAYTVYPFAARSVRINGQPFNLQYAAWEADEIVADTHAESITFDITIADSNRQPVLRIDRRYVLEAQSYDLRIEQVLTNLSDSSVEVIWDQNIHGDVVDDGPAYLGDQRRYVTGYFAHWDPARLAVRTDKGFLRRLDVIKAYVSDEEDNQAPRGIWPNASLDRQSKLVWLASENRYFALVTHAVVPRDQPLADDMQLEQTFPGVETIVLPGFQEAPDAKPQDRAVIFTLRSRKLAIEPQQTQQLDLAVFAGPRKKHLFETKPFSTLNFDSLIRYELGCTWCTFQPLARFLLWFLTKIHGVMGDWGIAIIILVCVVRLILHPLTKRAQVNMMMMGKQMQALQPEMDKMRKKFKDQPQKMQQEQMRLFREKGVNPFNMLGCLPMFLQMPIWVALYAMLYYAIELRHEPAFYGVFQKIAALFGGSWTFLGSLSDPDRLIQLFAAPKPISLLLITLDFQYLNILPLLMGVVFFFQQKLTTPPATTDQARQQQMMMKFMVLLFPVFLYSAPSGLTLYILASTAAGIVDSYLVRKHVRQQEASGELFKKAKPRRSGGLMDRLAKAAEQKQRMMQERRKKNGGTPRGRTGKRRT